MTRAAAPHQLEKSVEIYGLCALTPFAAAVDSRIGAGGAHHSGSVYLQLP